MASEEWRSLRVGDRIRFISMPTGFGPHNCHRDTLEVYRALVERRRPLQVSELDDFHMPWVRFRLKLLNGQLEHHALLINHDGWVIVVRRKADK